ncbi:cupredoxin domain-containing protein [Microbacterium halophytorum]|uniref:cupredoxin domain-containing protein n=1 Tax=Microbacterium halophytorum TaxID=2067568 RepID=UPI000CFAA2D3|nr:cupredoxin domain-containing protein [Microbacterium halophytorum]
MIRTNTALRAAALAAMAGLGLAGCASGPSVEPTGETTTVTITAVGMAYDPAEIEVPLGDRLVVEFENADAMVHDITFGNGEASERVPSGGTETIDVGVVDGDMEFWCSVAGHRAQGMEGVVVAAD